MSGSAKESCRGRSVVHDAGVAQRLKRRWWEACACLVLRTEGRPLRNGSALMRIKMKGINPVRTTLASGEYKIYYYHRATGIRLIGEPGSSEFLTSFAQAERS